MDILDDILQIVCPGGWFRTSLTRARINFIINYLLFISFRRHIRLEVSLPKHYLSLRFEIRSPNHVIIDYCDFSIKTTTLFTYYSKNLQSVLFWSLWDLGINFCSLNIRQEIGVENTNLGNPESHHILFLPEDSSLNQI